MSHFEPHGTPETMIVRGTDGSTHETDVYPATGGALGICKFWGDWPADAWCVVHRSSGMVLATCKDGTAATRATSALGFAAADAGVFWEHGIEAVTANPEAMRRCMNAVRVYLAR